MTSSASSSSEQNAFGGSLNGSVLRARVVGAAQHGEELVAPVGPLRVFLHDLLEELGDVVLPGVAGIADVLTVVVPGLERVVLQGDEIERDVVESGFAGGHDRFLSNVPRLV